MQMETRVRIHAPREQVFAVFTNFGSAAQRIEGIRSLEVLTDGPVGVGTRFRETRVMFNREATEEMEIVEFDAPREYVVAAESCGSTFRTRFVFEDQGDDTEVRMHLVCKPVSLFAKIMSPLGRLMAGPMRKCLEADIADLKKACENPAAEPA